MATEDEDRERAVRPDATPPPADATHELVRIDPSTAAEVTQEIRLIASARAEARAESRAERSDSREERDDDDEHDREPIEARPDAGQLGPREPTPLSLARDEPLDVDELRDAWSVLDVGERLDGLRLLPREDAEDYFIGLHAVDQTDLLLAMHPGEQRSWMRLLEPDDVADVIQAAPEDQRARLLGLVDRLTRKEVEALLAYEEDEAGGLMNTRYARLRPQMTVDEALSYLRRQARTQTETIYYAYVLDADQKLLGVVSFRDLFAAPPTIRVAEIMETEVVQATPDMDQEALSRLFADHDLSVVPIVDADGVMKGIVTVDDIVDVVQEEATEDAQKFGGMEALDQPYLQVGWREMLRKRGSWLMLLMLGEMLTASAMGVFEHEIAKAVVLSLFIPLIISSGGNSGSQASTLVIRAMALGEVRPADIFRVVRRELVTGLILGSALGLIGFIRVLTWGMAGWYGEHYVVLAIAVALSLVGVVLFGTIAGSTLPFVLRRFGADPASASAPFVATLVDVTGLVIYFLIAKVILTGTLL